MYWFYENITLLSNSSYTNLQDGKKRMFVQKEA